MNKYVYGRWINKSCLVFLLKPDEQSLSNTKTF